MSEFVECQNCGRRFFAENIECPYCRGESPGEARTAAGRTSAGGMYGVLFGGFMVLLAVVAILALVSLSKTPAPAARLRLGVEAAVAGVTLVGLAGRRRWGRHLAIAFILANAAGVVLDLVLRGQIGSLVWGAGPAAMLLFLVPLCSAQAREHFRR